ncbi:hypothetical protein O3M35_008395 [Rhynocoris fuscipes]|uniref:Uncharacterized protein n=1 Tax=Rhynocoris fuscipes TaxID=488301 RepID=A0AAW1D653_9HEMI
MLLMKIREQLNVIRSHAPNVDFSDFFSTFNLLVERFYIIYKDNLILKSHLRFAEIALDRLKEKFILDECNHLIEKIHLNELINENRKLSNSHITTSNISIQTNFLPKINKSASSDVIFTLVSNETDLIPESSHLSPSTDVPNLCNSPNLSLLNEENTNNEEAINRVVMIRRNNKSKPSNNIIKHEMKLKSSSDFLVLESQTEQNMNIGVNTKTVGEMPSNDGTDSITSATLPSPTSHTSNNLVAVIGDEFCCGLRRRIKKKFCRNYDIYEASNKGILGVQILEIYYEAIKILDKNDFLILFIGSNDVANNRTNNLLCTLRNNIPLLCNTNIFLVEVPHNYTLPRWH